MWDPDQYLAYADERSRPFFDLVGRIRAAAPGYVVDVGCGPGQLTAALAQRWPEAVVEGVDSSAEMISAARQLPTDVQFRVCEAGAWNPGRSVDVIVSNAMLQWVPEHQDMLVRWASFLADGGWLAFQLPGNFDQPSHAVLRELAAAPRWRDRLAGVQLNRQAADPAEYLDLLAGHGLSVDAWETTYLHLLAGPDPVTEWYKGTGLRPVLGALDEADGAAFIAEYSERVRVAYPAAAYGTVLPFRRVFVVAHKP